MCSESSLALNRFYSSEKDRKTERQKDRKTERQKDRKTERQKELNRFYSSDSCRDTWPALNRGGVNRKQLEITRERNFMQLAIFWSDYITTNFDRQIPAIIYCRYICTIGKTWKKWHNCQSIHFLFSFC